MDKIGSVSFAGINWELIADDEKIKAARGYYVRDRVQCQIIVGTEHEGDKVPNDRIIENVLKAIVSLILEINDEADEYVCDRFLYPFAGFLHQFILTDTFDGESGTFQLGGVVYHVRTDDKYSYHREINGEHDHSIATIVLAGMDDETGGPRKPEYIGFIYIHEVTHALMTMAGMTKHSEKTVKTFGCFLYEVLTTLEFFKDGEPVKVWPKN